MRILQQHLDYIEYEPISKEISHAEEAEKKRKRYEEIVALFTTVEPGDDEEVARAAVKGTKEFLDKLKVNRVIIYPYAHLSPSLARPKEALEELLTMERLAKEAGMETFRAPFGWNKAFTISVKGHPLAEQSRVYRSAAATKEAEKAGSPPPTKVSSRKIILDRKDLPPNDHRILGQDMQIFAFADDVGAGLPLWLPNGEVIRHVLVEYMREVEERNGYRYVSTPLITKGQLYEKTGHLPYYADSMYPPMELEGEPYYLRPMNCPHHHMIFKQVVKSYRDLPLRLAEPGTTYRKELSGVTYGLIRVLSFTQNDAHIYVKKEQLKEEFIKVLGMFREVYEVMGVKGYWFRLSLPDFEGNPGKFVGDPEDWRFASEEIRAAMRESGLKFTEEKGEAAFYGPKIDVQIKNTLGKEETIATSQVDIVVPKRLGLTYEEGGEKKTVVVIHRAVLGSYERFIAYLLEQTQGRLPVWLSPVQVRVLTVSDEARPYAEEVAKRVGDAGIRVEREFGTGTIGGKIRDAQIQKTPYMLVIGSKEQEAGSVAVRAREGDVRYGVKLEDFIAEVNNKVRGHA